MAAMAPARQALAWCLLLLAASAVGVSARGHHRAAAAAVVLSPRAASIAQNLSAYDAFLSLYPAGAVAAYLAGLRNATFLVPNNFAVGLLANKTAAADIVRLRDNWLLYLTLPARLTRADFFLFLNNTVIYPYPTLFGMPLYGEAVLNGIYFVGSNRVLNNNAYLNRAGVYSDAALVVHGVDNYLMPPNNALFAKPAAFPPPFQPSACGVIQAGYSYEKNTYRPGHDYYTIDFSIVLNVFHCARNCTATPSCQGFSVLRKTCFFKNRLSRARPYNGIDTYVECVVPSPAPPQPPPPPPSPPPPPFKGQTLVKIPWFLGITKANASRIVEEGTIVSWVWADKLRHSIQDMNTTRNLFVGPGGGLNLVSAPFVFNYTFTKAGIFYYNDGAYSLNMQGIITVKGATSPSCQKPLAGFRRELNTNRPGYDYSIFTSRKRGNCAAACLPDSKCLGFLVYQSKCYLKYALSAARFLFDAEMYVKCE